ncbi:MAG: dephospho-CoA kinase [Kiritimatiellia bacterium]
MTRKIGLTGGIACGKSEVAKRLSRHRIPVLDTDEVSHEFLKPGHPVFAEVLREFGEEYLNGHGEINRRKLGEHVFQHPEALKKLNSIMHPEIQRTWRNWFVLQTAAVSVVAVPLLFEIGVEKDFDAVLCVTSPESMMVERLKQRNLTEKQALQRIRAQMPVDLKAEKSTWTFQNNGTLPELLHQVDAWVQREFQ